MGRKISLLEYRRRVFNETLIECMVELHARVLGKANDSTEQITMQESNYNMAADMCRAFYRDVFMLENSTVEKTTDRLSGTSEFIKDCTKVAGIVADTTVDMAKEQGVEFEDDDKVNLTDADKTLITHLFDVKEPSMQINTIRDSTIAALVAEDEKARQIRDALDVAKSEVPSNNSTEMLETTMRRLNQRGPSSLMNAIINNVSTMAIKDVAGAGNFKSVGSTISENADAIKTRSVAFYTLHEMASVFGITKYDSAMLKHISKEIYYNTK